MGLACGVGGQQVRQDGASVWGGGAAGEAGWGQRVGWGGSMCGGRV